MSGRNVTSSMCTKDFGGLQEGQQEHLADGSVFDRIVAQ